MNQQKAEVGESGGLSEDEIVRYLRSHPDFFERHERILLGLRIPHAGVKSSVSLVERQVAVLRERNDQLERRLKALVAVAKLNEQLVNKIHRLSLGLMKARSASDVVDILETALREDFSADRAALVLYRDESGLGNLKTGFAIVYDRDAADLQPFAAFTQAAKVRCGRLRARQKEVLFGTDDEALGSAAMVPLGRGGRVGFLVIGNRDENYFNPGKSTDFLDRLGELITVALYQEQ